MTTKKDLSAMTTIPLRRMASEKGVADYGSKTKDQLIEAILAAQLSPNGKIEEQFTDRHEMPLAFGQPVSVRVGTKWLKGKFNKGKVIDGDQYAMVIVDGADKPKMFHTSEVEIDKSVVFKPEVKLPVVDEVLKLGENMVEVPIVVSESEPEVIDIPQTPATPTMGPSKEISGILMGLHNDFAASKKAKAATLPTPKPEPSPKPVIATVKVGENNGFPISKHHDKLKDIDLQGICKDSPVKFTVSKTSKVNPGAELTGTVKSFTWDTQDKMAYFTVKVEDKIYYKKVGSVTKL